MKRLTFLSNDNNKLSCPYFCHITFAFPRKPVTWEEFSQEIEINLIDNSLPPIRARPIAILKFKLNSIPEFFSYLASGKAPQELAQEFMDRNKGASLDSDMAAYLFETTKP